MAYFDPRHFPTVSAFAQLERHDQNLVVRTCKQSGIETAVEALEQLGPQETDKQE